MGFCGAFGREGECVFSRKRGGNKKGSALENTVKMLLIWPSGYKFVTFVTDRQTERQTTNFLTQHTGVCEFANSLTRFARRVKNNDKSNHLV